MAKDDYYVIVYKILAYLYVQLKTGEPIDANMIAANGKLFKINESYHAYIISHLLEDGYIAGVGTKIWGGKEYIDLEECQITPRGIAYIFENSLLKNAQRLMKDIKDVTPFI